MVRSGSPSGCGRIRQPAVGERVGGEQVAEFVMRLGNRNREDGKQRESDCDTRSKDTCDEDGDTLPYCASALNAISALMKDMTAEPGDEVRRPGPRLRLVRCARS